MDQLLEFLLEELANHSANQDQILVNMQQLLWFKDNVDNLRASYYLAYVQWYKPAN